MSAEITGVNKLLSDLENRLGKQAMQRISDEALKAGAKVFVKELQAQVKTFSDGKEYSKGYTLEEITVSEPMWVGGVRTIKVHWRGPHGRYRVIHLNEWGTVKNPNPRGKGAIARALKNAENAYQKAIMEAVRRGL
ncbi:HK97-gp10 family putative phage morphogenesis protein [Oceanobacillus caeni]|uniref:HK97 gp10 family phage protein n=1 Tax=Oceanobacillus caeni TaxID=405946 RepID=A0ABR5MK59_9BACI|nr:HK97-gp10 family putative phage morphogenesis protein [Oceanobacillus caeni]KPH76073.1 hypothetical protein AFL42_07155 [Oceanobacillus caeni]